MPKKAFMKKGLFPVGAGLLLAAGAVAVAATAYFVLPSDESESEQTVRIQVPVKEEPGKLSPKEKKSSSPMNEKSDEEIRQKMRDKLAVLPVGELSASEKEGLFFMREEEKLARDVYRTLFDKWGLNIFRNISYSENRHTLAVKTILERYDLTDPVTDDSVGVFVSKDLQKLYDELTSLGLKSETEALRVGMIIEDMDIRDLQRELAKTDNEDIRTLYENLMRGSRNHMRAFHKQLSARGVSYQARYINEEEMKTILETPRERGDGKNGLGKGSGKMRGLNNGQGQRHGFGGPRH